METNRSTRPKGAQHAHRDRPNARREASLRAEGQLATRDEREDATRAAIRRCGGAVAESGELLEGIGLDTADASELFADAVPTDLRRHANRIRRIAVEVLTVSSHLQFIAGQLDALAAIRIATRAGGN
jgi:hypothetical protein